MSCCYKTTLPDQKTNSILTKFKTVKGMIFIDLNKTFNIPNTSILDQTRSSQAAKIAAINDAKDIGKKLVNAAIRNKMYNDGTSKQSIHAELAWNYHGGTKQCRHAMALIYFPQRAVLEFFDPTGYSTNTNAPIQDVFMDVVLFSIAETINQLVQNNPMIPNQYNIKTNSKLLYINMNIKSLNPDGHCNTWSLFFHYLRHHQIKLTSNEFKNQVLSIYDVINNKDLKKASIKQRELIGPVHFLFSNVVNSIVPGLNKLIDKRHPSSP